MFSLFGKNKVVVPVIDVAKQFATHLKYGVPLDDNERGRSGLEFRERFLKELDNPDAWKNKDPFIVLDFEGVKRISPSFAYVGFAYFRKYAPAERIEKKIHKVNLSPIKRFTIDLEVQLFIDQHDPFEYLK